MGYDIGVAAPPDIILNVGHEHFRQAPSELGFYATHEAHHVGFLAYRPSSRLTDLNDPGRLRELIGYMTHLEGMGVHAAYSPRQRHGGLAADQDYRIYTDDAEADRVVARYFELLAGLPRKGRISDDEVGRVLNAMSSGERVWYRFGALVCRNLERSQGRRALVESIANPTVFSNAVTNILKPESSTSLVPWRGLIAARKTTLVR
jgi:hypothetical protein